jgi:hypothetical protein
MFLNQLVAINEKGSIASSVNFGMMDNPELNLHLCEQFIFNYDQKKPESSTVGILDALRRSYHSPNEPNIHLMIQDYGKGKSHFAVVIANYFRAPFHSPQVQGILHQVEVATKNKHQGIAEGLKLHKQNQQHNYLVICLSGEKGGDIKKQFLQVLVASLAAAGVTDSLAQHTCSQPLHYLERLDEQNRAKAEAYLRSINYADGDLNSIIRQLRENNPSVIPTVKELAYHVTGFTPDFSAHIDIEAILQDLLQNYCTGANNKFPGILILLDELNYYLQSWSADQIGAGGTALQNITNICENYKGKIAIISFAQFHPSRAIGISGNTIQTYQKIATRLAPKDSTYDNPVSSLELVLDNLLMQKEDSPHWAKFYSTWQDSLQREARIAYEQRIKIYQEQGWTLEDFYRRLGQGCFPLHPLTAYLLCNLDFTQDRTAIQFIKGYVKKFIQVEPVEKVGKLNYIYPIELVDTFVENFSKESVYKHYETSLGLVAGADDPEELTVLKALFLFYACGNKLTKPDREEHQEILATLTGLSKPKLKVALDSLEKKRDIIYYRPETKSYCFWEGTSPTGLEKEIENKIKHQPTSIDAVVDYCQKNIQTYLGDATITATQFVISYKLVGEDWQFQYKIYSIERLIKDLQTLKSIPERGILAYVLAETQEELREFRHCINTYLEESAIKSRIAIAIPTEETGDLARVLLKIKTLEKEGALEKQFLGLAYKQLLQRWQDQLNTQLERLLKYCSYHCVGLEKIATSQQQKPQQVISLLLEQLYPLVPPVDTSDKMRQGHTTGSKIVSFVSRQILIDHLTPQSLPDKAYKTVIDAIFVSSWGLLKGTSQKYVVQEPTNDKIRHAWDRISQICELGKEREKSITLADIWQVLSLPPYGYSEYSFTVLLAGWLAFHAPEVSLWGQIKLPAKKGEPVYTQQKPLKDWVNPDTDILQKPATFVSDWIVKGKAKLIRRRRVEMPVLPTTPMDYNQAQEYLAAVAAFLATNEVDPVLVEEINTNREDVSNGVEEVNNWLQPVGEVETLCADVPLVTLLQLYHQLMAQHHFTSVQPTQAQCDRQTHALQNICEKIIDFIKTIIQHFEVLSTEEACHNYQVEIQKTINQLDPIPNLPPHLRESLQVALRQANSKLMEIREQAQVENCLSQIHSLNQSLKEDATQQDYINIRVEIETLARNIPRGSQEGVEVEQILQNIDQGYGELCQKIEIWAEQAARMTSHSQILDLLAEINRQHRRFTAQTSQERLSVLQEQLKQEVLKVQSRDEAEDLVRAELSIAENKLQRIRDLSLDRMGEVVQLYQELIHSSVSLSEYQQQLDAFKAQGRVAVAEKFAYKPHRLEDCDSWEQQLQRCQNILANTEDLGEMRDQALQDVELRRQELRQAADGEIMQAISKYQSANQITTIHLGEQAIREIETLRGRLHHPDQWTAAIEQVLNSIEAKLTTHRQNLLSMSNRLARVDSLVDLARINTEWAKLELIFQDSADYSTYEDLQQQIQLLSDDLTQIENLEARLQQCDSISSCQAILAVKITCHEHRFQGRIQDITAAVGHKIQTFISELQEFEQELLHLTTVRDAQLFQEELLKKSPRYLNSDVAEQYAAIKLELQLLIEFLQIGETIKTDTLDGSQEKLARLREYQGLSANLQERLEALCAEITQQQLVAVGEWLGELCHQCTQMQMLDEGEKLSTANGILHQIQQYPHRERLNPLQQQSLADVERQCLEEQGRDTANQIWLLFQQLPQLQQQNLYERLGQYLAEDGHG